MRYILLVALAPLVPLSVTPSANAAIPAASNQAGAQAADAAAQKPLSRADIDLLLRQARSAIQQGQLEQAESLLSRAEAARIHYSLFYTGPTPNSVRRELNRAQRSQRSGGNLQGSNQLNGSPEGAADPFLARSQAAQQDAPAAAANAGLQTASAEIGAEGSRPTIPASATLENSRPYSQQPANPFARPQAIGGSQTESFDGQNMQPGGISADRPAAALSADAKNIPWPLPSGQTPPPLPALSSSQSAAGGSMPQLSPNAPAGELISGLSGESAKKQALAHLGAARAALKSGDIQMAEKLNRAASAVGVPESQFLPDEDRPSLLAWDIARTRQNGPGLPSAGAISPRAASPYEMPLGAPTGGEPQFPTTPAQATLSESGTAGQERWAALPEPLALPDDSAGGNSAGRPDDSGLAQQQAPAFTGNEQQGAPNQATQLLQAGEEALERHDRQSALQLFSQAHSLREQLDEPDQQRLQDRLQMLAAEPIDTTINPARAGETTPEFVAQNLSTPADEAAASDDPDNAVIAAEEPISSSSLLDATGETQQVLARQISAEVFKRQSEAIRVRETDPQRALTILVEARQLVEDSKLAENSQKQLLGQIERVQKQTQAYIDDHKSEIDLDQQNQAVLDEVQRRRDVKLKVQQKTAEMVDEFNRLRDEQRYAEMEIVARRLHELAPEDPVSVQILQQAKFIRRTMMNDDLMDRKDSSFWDQLNDVEESAINPVAKSGSELVYDAQKWELLKDRKGTRDRIERRTQRELEIERKLKTPVMLRYEETPLTEVLDGLSQLTGVNIHLDPRGLTQEGINTDTPVTISLSKEISLKSALNLILEPLHLTYVVTDEVLKVTSEQLRDGELITKPYNVADLVIPIPNFVPNNNIGLQGLINEAHHAMGYGNGLGSGAPAVLIGGRNNQNNQAGASDHVLAQQINAAAPNGLSPSTVPIGAGPGGMGGGANADFDSLIDLIVSTISTETWAENGGGEAEIRPFPTNLSLVISQTQAVHEEIADLLEQLRRLQDLQVTIEVRFIRLNDRFFERIGIDFDMNIEDRTIGTADLIPGQPFEPGRQSAIVGLQQAVLPTNPFPNYTADLDVPFRQPSFDLAIPPVFSGFGGQAATFGFAILSDIEAFFLIEAAQGDQRTNILNAPKVTLFNGQQAFVSDAVSQPFVIGVIPVVGEFVAAQQPVIVVLNEGTMMTIQAVVSDDRRYVRLTVVPFFTEVGDVQEFTFEGSTSTTNSSSARDDDDDGKNEEEEESDEEVRSGVTVQLPAFQFVTVVTTVSVPDGGTVLLGGIKRLSEGRNEFGVPLLSKVPYINRLFRNIGIGRDTDSLMMMVTPRIIIQEEEEERLGIAVP
jgi:general secretion pathway protein D